MPPLFIAQKLQLYCNILKNSLIQVIMEIRFKDIFCHRAAARRYLFTDNRPVTSIASSPSVPQDVRL